MGFGIGLGYMAQGAIQGRQQNIQNRLQEEQNQRAEDANQRAEAAAMRAEGLYPYQEQIAQSNATIATNNASPENLGHKNTTNAANAELAGLRVTGAGLQNQQTHQRIELNEEQLTPEAKSQRQQSSAIDLRIKQRNEQLSQLKHTGDMAAAKRQQDKLTDIDAYETIQRLRQGDKQSALRLFNGMDSNGIYDATDLSFDQQGNLHIKRQSGEDLIYPVNAIGAIEQRVKSEIEKSKVDKSPKVYTEKQYNDMGSEIGERAYIVSQDPKTGQQYKQYIEERPENQITPQEEIQTAIDMVRNNELTPQQFKSWYGFDAPVTGNTAARPVADDEFSDGDIAKRPSSGFGLNQF